MVSGRALSYFPMTADNYSSQQSGSSIAGEQLGIARVHAQHLEWICGRSGRRPSSG
jgi:hypothetical protein